MDDQARAGRPDVRGDRRGKHRRDDKIRVEKADPVPQRLIPERQLDRHLMAAVRQLGMHPLRHAVVAAGNQQDPHQRSPPLAEQKDPRAPSHRPHGGPAVCLSIRNLPARP
jgi:hypothetical protein